MKPDLALSRLGLAMRAGRVISGEEAVLEAIRSGEAKLVVLASDASENTKKKFRDKCSHYNVMLMTGGTRFELGAAIGKTERVVLAVTDEGFAALIAGNKQNRAEVGHIDQKRK